MKEINADKDLVHIFKLLCQGDITQEQYDEALNTDKITYECDNCGVPMVLPASTVDGERTECGGCI